MLIVHLNFSGQQTAVDWGNCSRMGPNVSVNPFRFDKMSFKPGDQSTSDSSDLTASCFPLDLLGVELGPTMFVVTSGYSTLENDFFFRDPRLLAEFEADDNRLKNKGLFI